MQLSAGVTRLFNTLRRHKINDEMLISSLERLQSKGFEKVPFDHLLGVAGLDIKDENFTGVATYPGIIAVDRQEVKTETVTPEQQVVAVPIRFR